MAGEPLHSSDYDDRFAVCVSPEMRTIVGRDADVRLLANLTRPQPRRTCPNIGPRYPVHPRQQGPDANCDRQRNADSDMVRLLLSLGADPNARDPRPAYSCHLGAAAGKPEIADALIRVGADANCRDGLPLKRAAGDPRPIAVHFLKTLLSAHATVDIDEGSPLREAIEHNNIEGAKLLLAAGANPDLDAEGFGPPLVRAIMAYPSYWDPTMFIALLNAGANPNYREVDDISYDKYGNVYQGETLLTTVAEQGYFELARILLEHGADPHAARPDGTLPARVAEKHRHPEIAALIEKYAAGRHNPQ